ncbi:MAG: zinc ribbon domain-containing protein, partial [Chloroflexota bacterium]|nr:zinc ribbon domain-containing protein [Chloroflexota bacterium]
MAIRCHNCGNENPDDYAFCDECGARLTSDEGSTLAAAAASPAGGTPADDVSLAGATPAGGLVHCPSCGAANVAGAAFCDECGAALTDATASTSTTTTTTTTAAPVGSAVAASPVYTSNPGYYTPDPGYGSTQQTVVDSATTAAPGDAVGGAGGALAGGVIGAALGGPVGAVAGAAIGGAGGAG